MADVRRTTTFTLPMRLTTLALLTTVGLCAKEDGLLSLTDDTLQSALDEHKLMLLSIGIEGCEPCAAVERMLRKADKELRVKASGALKPVMAKLTITSQDSPVIAEIVQGQLTLPKLLIFREGEAMDFSGTVDKAGVVETMLREVSRSTILTLGTVKQTERFLHLDSWAAQHSDEEKPPRVVGFFPSNETAGYAIFASMARKLQGMISFGEVFDPALQKKFLGSPTRKSVVRVYKADKKERALTYDGPLAIASMARWVATHSLSIVQDLTTESSIEAHMARGVPVFLLLMPDDYEDSLGGMMKVFRSVAARVRNRLLFAYGFKDTEPWPQFSQSLGIDRNAIGAFWMIVGNNMAMTGRNWSMAWLKPPSLGFQIYAMEGRGDESPEDVTEKKVNKFVDNFIKQVDAMVPPLEEEGLVEEEVEASSSSESLVKAEGGQTEQSAGAEVAAEAAAQAANHDKELRKLISSLEMSFNSGIANVKKVLDEVKDNPQLLAGKTAGLTSTVTSMDLKVKKGVMDLKRKLMNIGQKKDEL